MRAARMAVSASPSEAALAMDRIERLLKRADFVKCSEGRRWNTAALAVQARPNGLAGLARLGFTVSRKNGNAVIRNRIRRRLKAAAAGLSSDFAAGHDYVIVARVPSLTMPFEALKAEIAGALAGLQRPSRREANKAASRRPPLKDPASAASGTP